MTSVNVGPSGAITLPDDVRERYGLAVDTLARVIETRRGVLLVPQTAAPMSPALHNRRGTAAPAGQVANGRRIVELLLN